MNQYWKYEGLTRTGHELSGTLKGSKTEICSVLEAQGIHILRIKKDLSALLYQIKPAGPIPSATLAQFFEDLNNMYTTGMPLPQIVSSLKETCRNERMVYTLRKMEERIAEGDSLTQAVSNSGIFPWIVSATLHAGEQSGKLQESFQVLADYFKRSKEIKSKMANALIYPAIVMTLLCAVMLFIGLKVIPQLQNLLPADAVAHGPARLVLALSAFIKDYWYVSVLIPILIAISCRIFRKHIYHFPLAGSIAKESDLSYYFLNLSILLKSGIPLMRALSDLNAIYPNDVSRRMLYCRDYMYGGMPFWESVRMDNFFSAVVVFTLRRGEEMARLDEYCSNLADYFNKRVALKMDWLTHLIQPALLLFGALFLVTIAFAFLVPIYGNLTKIAGG
jgi:type II secretory pathway component PulF